MSNLCPEFHERTDRRHGGALRHTPHPPSHTHAERERETGREGGREGLISGWDRERTQKERRGGKEI